MLIPVPRVETDKCEIKGCDQLHKFVDNEPTRRRLCQTHFYAENPSYPPLESPTPEPELQTLACVANTICPLLEVKDVSFDIPIDLTFISDQLDFALEAWTPSDFSF